MTDATTGRMAAIVLAGGRSARFGRDKLAESIDGRPLLERAIEGVRVVRTGIDVVVVLAPNAVVPLPTGVRVAHDDHAFEGPLAGLAAGLRALPDSVDIAIVVGGDMPSLDPAVLARLVDAVADDGDVGLAVLDDGVRARPLPAALRRVAAAPVVEALLTSGERRLRALGEQLPTVVIPAGTWRVLDPTGATLRDIDTLEDLPTSR